MSGQDAEAFKLDGRSKKLQSEEVDDAMEKRNGNKSGILACLLAGALFLGFQMGCETASSKKPLLKDGKTYGVTSGSFRGRWWGYYERGESYADGQFWKEAEADLRTALRLREEDHRRARTYGMHFIDYFPHRELGMVLYHQERYEEAIRELEASLKSEKSAKAELFLDRARKSLILQQHADALPPEIEIRSPAGDTLSNASTAIVEGLVRDDTYVKTIQVNGRPVRMDLAVREVPFRAQVALREGENLVQVVAVDLTGKTTVAERTIHADRQGPILSIDEPLGGASGPAVRGVAGRAALGKGAIRLRGYAYDGSGLKEIRVNGQKILDDTGREAHLDYTLPETEAAGSLVVEAVDRVGNQTRAEIPLSGVCVATAAHRFRLESRRVQLASLEIPPLAVAESPQPQPAQEPATPHIELKSWTDRQTVLVDQVYLEGSARDESGIAQLAINGQSVLRRPGKSVYFNHLIALNEGENLLRIEAQNAAGRHSEEQIRINRKLQKVREVGSRLTVALLPLERKGMTGQGSESVEEALLGGLVERGRFEMVERQRLEEILKEQKLGGTELADPGTAIRVGKIAVAACVLMGATVEKEGSLEIYARLVDTETSSILTAVDVYGEDTAPQALKQLCQGLILKLMDECPLVEGLVVQIKGSRVIVDLGKEAHIKKGMRLIIFEEGEPIRHPVTGALLGADVEELGRAVVQAVHAQMSDVEVLEKAVLEKLKPAQKVITQ